MFPSHDRGIEDLRPLLNIRAEQDFVLIVAWLLAALRPRGPYPLLVLAGEQGSAKSTFSRCMKAIIDPNNAPLRNLPVSERDFFIAANNGYLLAFDNLSNIPARVSDTLCRLATGGGFATRQLYTDQDEAIFTAQRPLILNGIEDVITRSDLADRALMLTLEPIAEESRRTEKEFWADFDAALPGILGALFDTIAHGLRMLPETRLSGTPRMADFAVWVTACEGALWPTGTFQAAYACNRGDAIEMVLEASPVASGVQKLMEGRPEWSGTATELLMALEEQENEQTIKAKSWPKSPRGLSGELRRAAPFLRKAGISMGAERASDRKRSRILVLSKQSEQEDILPSTQSASSDEAENRQLEENGPIVHPAVRTDGPECDASDIMDGTDAKNHTLSE